MTKELHTKTCAQCGLIFRTDSARKRLCPTYLKANHKEQIKQMQDGVRKVVPARPKIRRYNVVSIRRFAELIEQYNRRYGTHYTYGQIMQKLDSGEIRGNEFYI